MDKDECSRLQPLPSRSVFKIIGYLLLQIAVVPLQRLFSIKTVEGWDCITQIFVNYVRYSVENELHCARKAEETITRFLNIGIKERLVDLKTLEFRGSYIGREANSEDAAILLYFHGGGYSLCSVQTYLSGLLDIHNAFKTTNKLNLSIFGLEYTRAPEAKYPSQINEAVAAYKFLREKFNNHPLFVMGDSAGGNLALALLLKLKQSKLQQPDGTILISPWVKMISKLDQTEKDRDSDKDFVTSCQLVHHTHRYLTEPITAESVQDPLVSPLFGDFSGTGPILVHFGGYEWLLPQIEELIENLRGNAVDLTVVKEPCAPHIIPLGAKVCKEMGMKGVNAIANFIASTLKQ